MKFDRHAVVVAEPKKTPYDNLSIDKTVGGSLYFAIDEKESDTSIAGLSRIEAIKLDVEQIESSAETGRPVSKKRGLSERELEIIKLVSTGMTSIEMASKLKISTNTIKNHLTNVFNAIGVGNRTEATLWYLTVYKKDKE